MKKYYIVLRVQGAEFGTVFNAMRQETAIKKAFRSAKKFLRVTDEEIQLVSCEYQGFYLGRAFFPVKILD